MTTTMRRLVLVAGAGIVLTVGGYGCGLFGDAWRAPAAVTIESEKDVTALMPTWVLWHGVGGEQEPQGLLLRDGDYFDADMPLRYAATDGTNLKVTVTDWAGKIGDTTVSLSIDRSEPEDGSAWLRNAPDAQLARLRTLGIENEIDPAVLPALKRLAAVNPSVDLAVDSAAAMVEALALFHPRAFFGPEDADAETLRTLASQPQIEMLWIQADEPGSLDVLASLPKLRTLVLNKWTVEKAGALPAGLTSLRSLAVFEGDDLKDLAPLGPVLATLEELTIGLNEPADLTGIDKMTRLRTLVLSSSGAVDLSKLDSLKDLRWVALPASTTQAQFAAFVGAHPNLAILELIGNDEVTDLSPLETLKGLQGVILGGPYDSLAPIQKLTTLRFVGVSKKQWEAGPAEVEALRKALPDALVVKVAPFCLGSGWVLLLVPVPFAAWWWRRRA